MWPGIAENWLAPRPGEMPTGQPPVAPDLTYEDYKAQPPSLRFAGIQPNEMSPYEITEYADEMAARYGRWPSELLSQPGGELNLNFLIYQTAAAKRDQNQARAIGRSPIKSQADILMKMLNLEISRGR